MATLSVTTGGSGPLLRAVVQPFLRENLPARSTLVRVDDPSGGGRLIIMGPRMRKTHLLALDSTGSRRFRAATKDNQNVWSELSAAVDQTTANYSTGATEGSIGSGGTADIEISEPSVNFPDLSFGSGIIGIHRTLVYGSFPGQTFEPQWAKQLAAFRIIMHTLDDEQVARLHTFFKTLNGPRKPFFFDFVDPNTSVETRYVVRFRDPKMNSSLIDVDYPDVEFNLIEEVGVSLGGDI